MLSSFRWYDWRSISLGAFFSFPSVFNAIHPRLSPSPPSLLSRLPISYLVFSISYLLVFSLRNFPYRDGRSPLSSIFRDSPQFPFAQDSKSLPPPASRKYLTKNIGESHTSLSKCDINVSGGRKIHGRHNDLSRADICLREKCTRCLKSHLSVGKRRVQQRETCSLVCENIKFKIIPYFVQINK